MDREKVIKKLTVRIQSDSEEWNTIELPIEEAKEILALLKEQEGLMLALEQSNAANEYLNAEVERLTGLLKEQEVRELTMDEWREWKADSRRSPICMLWENDTSPIWIHNPNVVHEPALLMGKLKLFTGKPTLEQCKEVKWDD